MERIHVKPQIRGHSILFLAKKNTFHSILKMLISMTSQPQEWGTYQCHMRALYNELSQQTVAQYGPTSGSSWGHFLLKIGPSSESESLTARVISERSQSHNNQVWVTHLSHQLCIKCCCFFLAKSFSQWPLLLLASNVKTLYHQLPLISQADHFKGKEPWFSFRRQSKPCRMPCWGLAQHLNHYSGSEHIERTTTMAATTTKIRPLLNQRSSYPPPAT